jgi:hypothetical protein
MSPPTDTRPTEDADDLSDPGRVDAGPATVGTPRTAVRAGSRRVADRRPHAVYRRRRVLATLAVLVAVFVLWVVISLGMAVSNPSYGTSIAGRAAEWARRNGGATLVVKVENFWYSHHAPKVGGTVPKGAIKSPTATTTPAPVAVAVPHLPAPANVVPPASPALPGEGVWSPTARSVAGQPALYTTRVRPDAVHTSYVVGMAWMDPNLLHATLYSGSQIPGGGPFVHSAPIPPTAADTLVAAFNAGFLMDAAQGGYYTDGRTVVPLRTGAASAVILTDGTLTVGQWGRDVSMSPAVVSVRQNLDLIVDGGQPVPGLNAADTTRWGFTLGNKVYVYRSGLGVTADGAVVYVGGPGLNITDLADLLVRAGAVRAMELDINTDWVNFAYFTPSNPYEPASAASGSLLLPAMSGGPDRYFSSYWSRDFFTMSSAYPDGPPTTTTTSSSSSTTSSTSSSKPGARSTPAP